MENDQSRALTAYLHAHIPLSAAMQVSVVAASTDAVVLGAPLEPNINHRSTVFGGSASAVAILAAWSLLHLRLTADGLPSRLVIQSNRMDYDRPISGAFTATSSLSDPSGWPRFVKTLARHKRARIEARAILTYGEAVAGRFEGEFVAFLPETA
ncbi:YiiD C-terminal domain-containing protein [Labrys monachus]|uniref:Thioesterase domain-containing protein n=1 Tax=Labrys monachus TaxID=217067 RepID=A0ABU0FDV1_9HYPH|nr:YiiD C-terminal domain-containing protein [Labrys monachus]MDQ0392784.1 thioesterase domain-containing protein [Labrys monachus]